MKENIKKQPKHLAKHLQSVYESHITRTDVIS